MDIICTPKAMTEYALGQKAQRRRIGFVPTMGYLHEGHLSLVRIAREHADVVVVSIFVNPTQFAPSEDLDKYPRDIERDERLCKEEDVDIIFYPSADDMYSPDHDTYVSSEHMVNMLCGASRPGHFRGVLTVVAKLFNIVLPDVAVFGRKDAQQLRLIEKMVEDLNMPVEILSGPIVREPDGVAMSSRNVYLSSKERNDATALRASLERAEELVAGGERNAHTIKAMIQAMIDTLPTGETDYVEIVDVKSLEPVETVDAPVLAAIAVRFGKARLIDNATLKPPE